jgi:hypothetical protein
VAPLIAARRKAHYRTADVSKETYAAWVNSEEDHRIFTLGTAEPVGVSPPEVVDLRLIKLPLSQNVSAII